MKLENYEMCFQKNFDSLVEIKHGFKNIYIGLNGLQPISLYTYREIG